MSMHSLCQLEVASWYVENYKNSHSRLIQKVKKEMRQQLKKVCKAYDLTVEQHEKGIDPLDGLPEQFKETHEFKEFRNYLKKSELLLSSGAPDIKGFLNPRPGMRFLDVGCCANLARYRLDQWPSSYYGVDISPALMRTMNLFVARQKIAIGGLWVADISDLPFHNDFFDICSVIGVFEYCTFDYIKESLAELNRVLRPCSKIVLDIPNPGHQYVAIMRRVEEYLGRPNILHPRLEFEKLLANLFSIERCDASQVMLKYFAQTIK